MAALVVALRRRRRAVVRRAAEMRMFAAAMASRAHPILAQVVPIRRCNLACRYCNEFDSVSQPVPLDEMLRRIDRLGELGTSMITSSGGEPPLHPERRGDVAASAGRGRWRQSSRTVPPHARRIDALNQAGLDYLQVSIDNTVPDDASRKVAEPAGPPARVAGRTGEFAVTINTVVAPGLREPNDALAIARRARALGFNSTVGIAHDTAGRAQPLSRLHLDVHAGGAGAGKRLFSVRALRTISGEPGLGGVPTSGTVAPAAAICTCASTGSCTTARSVAAGRGSRWPIPGEDIEREGPTPKPCAPLCSVSCVHQTAMLDRFATGRGRRCVNLSRRGEPSTHRSRRRGLLKAAAWLFLEDAHAAAVSRLAARLLGIAGPNGGAGGTATTDPFRPCEAGRPSRPCRDAQLMPHRLLPGRPGGVTMRLVRVDTRSVSTRPAPADGPRPRESVSVARPWCGHEEHEIQSGCRHAGRRDVSARRRVCTLKTVANQPVACPSFRIPSQPRANGGMTAASSCYRSHWPGGNSVLKAEHGQRRAPVLLRQPPGRNRARLDLRRRARLLRRRARQDRRRTGSRIVEPRSGRAIAPAWDFAFPFVKGLPSSAPVAARQRRQPVKSTRRWPEASGVHRQGRPGRSCPSHTERDSLPSVQTAIERAKR